MLGPICLNKQHMGIVDNDKHIGNYISKDIHDRNIVSSVCDLYQRNNSTISDFNPIRYGLFQTVNDPGGGGL